MSNQKMTEFENVIQMLQCYKFKGLGQEQKDALHKFKAEVARAFGDCERAGVPKRTILAVMLLRGTGLNSDILSRETLGASPASLKNPILVTPCSPKLTKTLSGSQQSALHKFKEVVGNAFGECEKVVSARIILAVFSEHSAELNADLAAQELAP